MKQRKFQAPGHGEGFSHAVTTDNVKLSEVIKNVNIGAYAFKLPSVNMPIIERATENIYISFYILLYFYTSFLHRRRKNGGIKLFFRRIH